MLAHSCFKLAVTIISDWWLPRIDISQKQLTFVFLPPFLTQFPPFLAHFWLLSGKIELDMLENVSFWPIFAYLDCHRQSQFFLGIQTRTVKKSVFDPHFSPIFGDFWVILGDRWPQFLKIIVKHKLLLLQFVQNCQNCQKSPSKQVIGLTFLFL